jgi:hypothetical protein
MNRSLVAAVAIALSTGAAAETTIQLPTPHTITLNPAVNAPRCSAWYVTTAGYQTVVTGFSADGNYVLGQVSAYFTCGSSGRGGGGIHTYYSCAQLTWDLTGALVSATDPITMSNGYPVSTYCPSVPLNQPSMTPPSNSVVGNEFTNAGNYTAETVVEEICGSAACYQTYYYPTLITP